MGISGWPAGLRRLGQGLALFVLATAAAALTPESARFRSLGLEHGLSQPSVKAMAQDRDGLLWFGTQVGLNRYDGSSLRVFNHDPQDPHSLSHNTISALLVDRSGVLWVGTDGGGLNCYDAALERFVVFRGGAGAPLPDDTVNTLLAGPDGELWVGTEGGLARWRPQQQAFVAVAAAPDVRIRALAWADNASLWVGTPGGLLRYALKDDRWLPVEAPAEIAANVAGPVRQLLASADGSVWIGGDGGLAWWHPQRGEARRWRHDPDDPDSLGNDVIGALLRDRDGRLWVGHEAGVDALVEQDGETRVLHFRHQRQSAHSLGSGRIASLLQDRAGGLWIGTWSGGASLLNPYSRRILSFGPDIPVTAAMREPEVPALAAQEPSTLWLGGRGGLFEFDVVTRRFTVHPALRGERIYGIVVRDEALLLGSERGLLTYLPQERRLAPVASDELAGAQINLLQRDGERLWVGTREPGLLLVDLRSLALLRRFPADGLLRFVAPFDERHMLVGTAHGLFWHDRNSGEPLFRHVAEPGREGALASSVLSSFLRTRNGQLWLATNSGGLHRMTLADPADPASARFEVFSRGQGPVADTISALLEDGQGRLWMSSSRGIVRFDPMTQRFTSYLVADGSLGSGYYANVRAQFASGVMAFAGPDGFTLVDPRAASEMPPPPSPLPVELLLDNRVVAPGSPELPEALLRRAALSLPAARARSLGLRFAAPDTLSADQLHYAYKLDGFDADWVETDSRNRQATYTNLAPGEYRFRVVAINQDGQRSPQETVLALALLPSWWQTGWAKLIGLVLGMLLVYAIHAWQVRRLELRRRQLQREVAERTAELTDSNRALNRALDDLRRTQRSLVEQEKMASLGALVAGVAHEINTPVGIALTSASHLNEVTHAVIGKLAAGKLTQSDFVSFRDAVGEGMRLVMSSLDRAHALVASFKQVAVDQSSEQRRRIVLREFLDEVRLSLQPSYRQTAHRFDLDCQEHIELDTYPGALFQIFTNLVNNSLLHGFVDGRIGVMRLQARGDGDRVVLRYSDNGVGMPAEVAARAFEPFFTTRRGSGGSGLGLHIVYNLATQLLGGSIALQPSPSGLQVTLRIPIRAPQRAAG